MAAALFAAAYYEEGTVRGVGGPAGGKHMTLPGETIKERAAESREFQSTVTGPRDALDICGALVEALRDKGGAPDDCALTYSGLSLMRYLGGKIPSGEDKNGALKRWEHLELPLKINWTLSDRARYEPWIARAAGKLREMTRGLVISDDNLAFLVANLLRQTSVESGAVARDSRLYRHCLALLDYLERGGASVDTGQPSYENGGKIPCRSTFEIEVRKM
jgi:hypothetical protein